jgi:hypothetical protein
MEGALEFLRACGFQELELDGEAYLVFSEENREGAMDLEVIPFSSIISLFSFNLLILFYFISFSLLFNSNLFIQ